MERAKYPATTSATPTDIPEENGTPTSRLLRLTKMAEFQGRMYAHDASAPVKSPEQSKANIKSIRKTDGFFYCEVNNL